MSIASSNKEVYIDMELDRPIDFASLPMADFQTVSTDSLSMNISRFNLTYSVNNPQTYRITITPTTPCFINNLNFTVTTMPLPTTLHTAIDNAPFQKLNYNLTASLPALWTYLIIPYQSALEESITDSLNAISNQISAITTLPYVQEINKAGLFSFACGGAQLTSTSVLVNSIPPPNSYEGARLWSNFIFFDTPNW